ncbi:ATP-binding protein [Adlercreutzia sp. ZJ473]|uniref:ATP-binding protein n=1 Tax=Adlercreutzia sp. ZJ473 TaxID=2722822 RepID=UPI001C12ED77
MKVVTGVRRCGKSYLLFNLFKEHLLSEGAPAENIVEVAFDEYESKKLRDPEVFYPWVKERLAADGKHYVLLDEVQLLGDFEEVLIGLMRMPGVDVYVTGSNAKLLSKDVITEFRGRGDEVRVRPLSFSEFMGAYDGDVRRGFEEYSVYGGMPATVGMEAQAKASYLEGIFSEIYVNDIAERNNIRDAGELEALLNVLSSGIGSLTNPKKVSDTFKSKGSTLSPKTARAYIDQLIDAFVIEEAKRYDVKGRAYIGSPFKYYFCDLGLRNARMNFRQVEPSHAMENVIYNELVGRGFGVDVGIVNAFSKNAEGRSVRSSLEVDFVCNKGDRRFYIQSAYVISSQDKMDQELASLRRVGDSFEKIVVVRDPIVPRRDESGFLFVGVEDFLLDESFLS